MAIRDHKARAHPSVSEGIALSDPFDAYLPASPTQAHSLRVSTLDDVALALYALVVLDNDDERCRRTQAYVLPEVEPLARPLPPLFKEGLGVAIQCLEGLALRLGSRGTRNA